MASTASDVQAQAAVDSWLNSQSVKDMQQSIEDAYQAGVNQATSSNQQIINQLNQNAIKYQNKYNQDAKQAYTNKELNLQTLAGELQRMGLTNSGYGVSQKLLSNSAYSKNLAGLQTQLADDLAGIDLEKQNQQLAYQAQLQELLKNKSDAMYNYNQYISDMSEQIRQNEIANQLQQRYYDYLYANMYANSSGGSGGSGVSLSGDDSGVSLDGSSGNESYLTNVKKSSPVLSNQNATKWYINNIGALERQGGVTQSQLEAALDKGLSEGVINEKDIDKILSTFGL